MNLMTWLTGKTLAELVKKGQLIPPEIKLPVYPASHYKKNWYEQGNSSRRRYWAYGDHDDHDMDRQYKHGYCAV